MRPDRDSTPREESGRDVASSSSRALLLIIGVVVSSLTILNSSLSGRSRPISAITASEIGVPRRPASSSSSISRAVCLLSALHQAAAR
ncbi:hypothetical protein TYRP_023777 [Tyrophagus putrescentiae]|nr:hypothetical protein TYRP_023777 [Tyrophagus putrescentiae]